MAASSSYCNFKLPFFLQHSEIILWVLRSNHRPKDNLEEQDIPTSHLSVPRTDSYVYHGFSSTSLIFFNTGGESLRRGIVGHSNTCTDSSCVSKLTSTKHVVFTGK